MKLTTDNGELPLPDDLEIEIEQNSPAFSEEGTYSLPVAIPVTGQSMKVLRHPVRLASSSRLRKIKATLSEGTFVKNGQLIMDSASSDGITCSFSYAESDFYTEFKTEKLRDIFANKQDLPIGVSSLYQQLLRVVSGELDKDYTLCPVAVDYDDESGSYKVNNTPDGEGGFEYESRYLPDGENRILVPEGYGLATFLYLYRMIELLFEFKGYTIESDVFRYEDDLKKIIVLHNVTDGICTGKIDYSDMVPDITVSEFLEWLHDKFLAVAVINSERRTVNICLMQDILSNKICDLDLTGKIEKERSISFSSSSKVSINVDTSLEGSAPPSDSLEGFVKSNPVITDVNETVFNASSRIFKYVMARRLATGDYYSFASSIVENNPVTSSARVGSSYFNYLRDDSTEGEESFSPADLMPPMVFVNGILMPYIGTRIHRHTQLEDKSESNTAQKIIIAYDSGYRQSEGYRIATTQNYDEAGIKWTDYSLNPQDIYTRFFSAYNGLIKRGRIEVSGNVVLSNSELLGFDIMKPKLFYGRLLLCTKLCYTIRRGRIDRGVSTFVVIGDVSNPDEAPVASAQKYYWKLNTENIRAKVDELEDLSGGVAAEAEYTLPEDAIRPASAPTSFGQTGYYQIIPVHYKSYSLASGEIFFDDYLDTTVWFVAEPL